jgi:hypothetical protein
MIGECQSVMCPDSDSAYWLALSLGSWPGNQYANVKLAKIAAKIAEK